MGPVLWQWLFPRLQELRGRLEESFPACAFFIFALLLLESRDQLAHASSTLLDYILAAETNVDERSLTRCV